MEGHSNNVSAVAHHPELPLIITGGEDHKIKLWHSSTYQMEKTLDYGWGRVWGVSVTDASNAIAICFDEGTKMIQVGQEEPAMSMDPGGKLIWARHHEILTGNLKMASSMALPYTQKES